MNYLPKAEYEMLYAKYIGRREPEILKLAGNLRGKLVVDLCGGAGRMSLAAIKKGARRVILVDACADIINDRCWRTSKPISVECQQVAAWLDEAREKHIDVALCCQGVNYWFNEQTLGVLATKIKRGGKFIFNTFNTQPPKIPVPKKYFYKGHCFMELSWSVGNIVHHVQIRDGLAPHTTSFFWISPMEYVRVLMRWFKIKLMRNGRSDIYVCTRK